MTTQKQIQCPNCMGYKTIGDSKKNRTMLTAITMFFLGSILTLFFLWFIGVPLMIAGYITGAIARNGMKEDGSMKCRSCEFKFKTEIANLEPVNKTQSWKLQK